MVDVTALGVKVSSTGVVETTKQLKDFTTAAGKAEDSAGGFEKGTTRLRPPVTAAGTEVKKLGGSFKELVSQSRSGVQAVNQVHGSMQRLAAVAGTMVGAFAALVMGNQLKTMADQWTDMQSRIGAATKDMEGAPKMMERMVEIAKASYSPLDQTVEVYSRNVAVLRDLGKNADQAADFTESLNHMLVITATKGERAASVQNALAKAMATGKLDAEGLESVLNNGGRVAEALADQLGTTTSGLRKMATEGRITGQVIADSVISNLEEVRRVAGEMPPTISDAMGQLGVSVLQFVGQLDQASGVSLMVATSIQTLADAFGYLASIDPNTWINAFKTGLTGLAVVLVALAATRIPALISAMVSAGVTAKALGATFLAQYYVTSTLATGVGVLRTALMALGGPIGIVLGAMAAVGTIMFANSRQAEPLSSSLDDVAESQLKLNAAVKAFDGSQGSVTAMDQARQQAEETVKIIEEQLARMKEAVEAAKFDLSSGGMGDFGMTDVFTEQRVAAVDALIAKEKELQAQLEAAQATQARLAQERLALAQKLGVAASELTEEQVKAHRAANDMLSTMMRSIELKKTELKYGKESREVQALTFQQERNLYLAKLDTMEITSQQRQQLVEVWMQEQRLEEKTLQWDSAMGQVGDSIRQGLEAMTNLSTTEPSGGWLNNAISKASTLASTLWGAWTAHQNLTTGQTFGTPLSASGGIAGLLPPIKKDKTSGTGGGGKGGGAAEVDEMADAAKKWIDRIKEAKPAAEKLNVEIKELNDLHKAGKLTALQHAEGMAMLRDEFIKSHPQISSIGDAIGDFVASGMRDFKGLLSSFKDMIKEMIATAVANPIKLAIGSAVFGGGFGGGAGSAAAGVAGQGMLGSITSSLGLNGLLGGGAGGGGMLASMLGSFGKVSTGGLFSVAGGTGFLGGLGNAISGSMANLFSFGGAAAAGGGIMATLGAAVPVIGIIAGLATLGKSLFGRKLKDTGLQGDFTDEGFNGQQYKYYKGGLFRSNKTTTDAMDPELQAMIANTFGEMKSSILDMASVVGIGAEAIEGFTTSFKFSTNGMSQEEASAKLQEELGIAGNGLAEMVLGLHNLEDQAASARSRISALNGELTSIIHTRSYMEDGTGQNRVDAIRRELAEAQDMIDNAVSTEARQRAIAIQAMMKDGEDAMTFLTRISSALSAVNPVMERLGLSAYQASVAGGAAASSFTELFGGLEGFMSASQAYYDGFYSDAEKFADAQKVLSESLAELGINRIPRTAEAFRGLVESMDARGAEEAVAALMQLGPSFLQFIRMREEMDRLNESGEVVQDLSTLRERESLERRLLQLQGNTNELRRRDLLALDSTNRVLQRQIWALEDAQAVLAERDNLERRLMAAQGDTNALRALELDALDSTNRALLRQIWASERAAQVAQERDSLDRRFLEAQGNTAGLRELELASLDRTNRALLQRIWAEERATEIAAERDTLERRLLEAQGDTAALRRLELAELDRTNRALLQQIWAAERAAEVAAERDNLERRLLEAQGDTAALRKLELSELDKTNRALLQQIWATERAAEVASERDGLERRLLEVQGDTAALRKLELASLDATNRALMKDIWAAEKAAQVASERSTLERRLLEVQGNTAAIRALELAALDKTNKALLQQIWATEKAAAVASERQGLEKRLLEVQGNTAELRRMELAGLDASNRALLKEIWATEKANAVASERATLEERLLQLQGNTSELKRRELAELDASNRQLLKEIWALEKAKEAASERNGLEQKYLELTGNTAEIRKRELAELDSTNRALQRWIYKLTDAQEQVDKATEAFEKAAEARQTEIDQLRETAKAIREMSQSAMESAFQMTEVQRLNAERQIRTAIQTGNIWDEQLTSLAEKAIAVDSGNFGSQVDYLLATARAAATLTALADAQDAMADSEQSKLEELLKKYGLETAAVLTLAEAVKGLDKAIAKLAAVEEASALAFGITPPAFATGGLHRGGLRIVGENGPELEATGSARYYGASTTQGMINGGGNEELLAEIRDLKDELRAIRAFSQKTADSTTKSAKLAQRVMIDSEE